MQRNSLKNSSRFWTLNQSGNENENETSIPNKVDKRPLARAVAGSLWKKPKQKEPKTKSLEDEAQGSETETMNAFYSKLKTEGKMSQDVLDERYQEENNEFEDDLLLPVFFWILGNNFDNNAKNFICAKYRCFLFPRFITFNIEVTLLRNIALFTGI